MGIACQFERPQSRQLHNQFSELGQLGAYEVPSQENEAALIEDNRLPPLSGVKKSLRPIVRAVGLELTAGLFLDCLDSPAETTCPCGMYIDDEGRPVPIAPAGQGLADARADYEGLSIIAEATIGKKAGREPLQRQYNGAVSHNDTILAERNARCGYCLMASRTTLRDEHGRALIVAEQAKLNRNHGPGIARLLPFGMDEMAHVADQLDRLYWSDEEVRRLTAEDLGDILDTLHDRMMAWISSGEPFPDHWAARQFDKLLRARQGQAGEDAVRPTDQAGRSGGRTGFVRWGVARCMAPSDSGSFGRSSHQGTNKRFRSPRNNVALRYSRAVD